MRVPRTLALLVGLAAASCLSAPEPELVLVETAPVETDLDHADLPETHEVWPAMIRGARERIDLAHFYASDRAGSRLSTVVTALEEAAARGVEVRFLADAGFVETYPDTLARLDARDGVEVRHYDLRARTGGVLHAKFMLVDGREAFVGSQNFDWRALQHIQELGVRLRVPAVAEALSEVFELDWRLAGDPAAATEVAAQDLSARYPVDVDCGDGETVAVTPVLSPTGLIPDEDLWDLPRLVAWIDAAERAVDVQLLSYSASGRDGEAFEVLDSALTRAAARGVRVRLLLSHWNTRSRSIGGLKRLQRVPGVEVRFATIPIAAEGFVPFSRVVHAKYMTVDEERAWIGTSNWSRDYFHASRNVGLLIEGAPVAERLVDFFEDVWTSRYAEPVDPERDYPEPRVGS
jgi:phosphatidylserine/phosphatidylglycerophosphate/cardiolipin synthase-like enzyme